MKLKKKTICLFSVFDDDFLLQTPFLSPFVNAFEEVCKTCRFRWIQNIVSSILSPSFFRSIPLVCLSRRLRGSREEIPSMSPQNHTQLKQSIFASGPRCSVCLKKPACAHTHTHNEVKAQTTYTPPRVLICTAAQTNTQKHVLCGALIWPWL